MLATHVRFYDFTSDLPSPRHPMQNLTSAPLSPKHNVEESASTPEKEHIRGNLDQLCAGGKGRNTRTLVSHGGVRKKGRGSQPCKALARPDGQRASKMRIRLKGPHGKLKESCTSRRSATTKITDLSNVAKPNGQWAPKIVGLGTGHNWQT